MAPCLVFRQTSQFHPLRCALQHGSPVCFHPVGAGADKSHTGCVSLSLTYGAETQPVSICTPPSNCRLQRLAPVPIEKHPPFPLALIFATAFLFRENL